MTDSIEPANAGGEQRAIDDDRRSIEGVPDWDDEYVDRVSDRLLVNYDLEKDERVRDERFTLYGELRIESAKQFLHPSITYANHHAREHLFVERAPRVDVGRLESLAELGSTLADEWVEPNEDHFGTEFTFAVVAPEIPDDARSFVEGFSERTLLRYGYHGHYEIHLIVVAPEREGIVSSANADGEGAFATWGPLERDRRGRLGRLVDYLRR